MNLLFEEDGAFKTGTILTDNDAYTASEFLRDPYQQEFVEPAGLRHFAGAIVASGPNHVIPLVLERRPGEGPFQREQIALLNGLFGTCSPPPSRPSAPRPHPRRIRASRPHPFG